MTPNIRTFPLSVRAAFVVAAFVVTLIPSAAQAQVVLNPGYISGTIAVNGETITNGTISASWTDGLGTHYSASAPVTGSTYNLAVQVPAGSTPEYTVSVSVNLAAPSALSFPSQFATVTAFATTTVNFIVDPGYIAASVTATTGSVSFVQFTASGDVAFASASASGASRTFPVYPAAAVTVFGNAVFSGGGYSPLDPQTVSVAAGATVSVSWLVTPPPPTLLGSMAGMYSFIGAVPDESTIEARCLNSNFATLTSNGSYLIPNLLASNCTIDTFATFNSGTSYLFLPDSSYNPTRNPAVSAGATTTVDINATAAFLSGTLTLTGTKSLSDASLVSLAAYGTAGTSTSGGFAGTSPSLSTGEYSLVLTDGPWSPGIIDLQFFDVTPGAYLQEVLQFVDNEAFAAPVVLAPGEAGVKNLTYGVGTVTVTFSVAGGGLLSNPSLFGTCFNSDNGSYYSFNSYGIQLDVALGSVTFVGMAGTCTVEAFADVGPSNTRFGGTTVVVVPGTEVVIDLNDPVNTPPSVSLLGPTPVLVGTTQTYTFAVTDPDAGATFTVSSVSCGVNGSQVGVTTTSATGGSFGCLFPAEGTSTVSVQVADNHSAPSNTAMLVVSIEKLTTTTAVVCPASVDYSGTAQTPCTATVTSSDGFSEVLTVSYTDNVSAGTASASAVFAGDATH